jgi:hypothetical protein
LPIRKAYLHVESARGDFCRVCAFMDVGDGLGDLLKRVGGLRGLFVVLPPMLSP